MTDRLVSVFLALALLAGGFVTYQQVSKSEPTYTVTADVLQAPNLFDGGRVMVRGVQVGAISEVEPRPEGVRLTMEIDQDVAIPADAELSVVPITVISDRYVQFYPAYSSGPRLEDGDHLAVGDTTIPAELDDVLTQLKGLLGALEPRKGEKRGPLAGLIRELDSALEGKSDDLAGTLEGSATVLENFADSSSDITRLISNLDRLFVSLANRSSEIGIVNERLALVMESLLGDQRNLEGTVENVASFSDEAAGLFSRSGDDLGESFGRLSRVLRAILRQQDELAGGIKWANVIAEAAGAVDGNGRGLYAYSGKRAPVGTAGAKYNYRIDQRDTIACERIEAVARTILIITPSATVDDLTSTLLSFIPEEYDDDLSFLIRQLVPLCTGVQDEGVAPLDAQTVKTLRAIEAEVGEERFREMLLRWYLEGYDVGEGDR